MVDIMCSGCLSPEFSDHEDGMRTITICQCGSIRKIVHHPERESLFDKEIINAQIVSDRLTSNGSPRSGFGQ